MTKLSVITAFHDAAAYLPDLLVTLSHAVNDDTEVIFVDDGSSDGGGKLAQSFPVDIPHLRVIRNDDALGPATSRNIGMDAAEGRYIAFIDGDDWIAPDYLTALVESMEHFGADFVRCDQVRVTDTNRTVYRAPEPRMSRVLDPSSAILPVDRATMVDYPYSHSGIFDRRLLDEGLLRFPDGLFTAEDRPWIWRLHLRARSFVHLPMAGYFYRRGVASSLTQIGDTRQLDFIRSFELVFDELEAAKACPEFVTKAIRQYSSVVSHHLTLQKRLEPSLRSHMKSEILRPLERFSPATLSSALQGAALHRRYTLRRLGLELDA